MMVVVEEEEEEEKKEETEPKTCWNHGVMGWLHDQPSQLIHLE